MERGTPEEVLGNPGGSLGLLLSVHQTGERRAAMRRVQRAAPGDPHKEAAAG